MAVIIREKKIHQNFFFPESLVKRLNTLVREPGSTKTQIVIDALSDFLDRDARPYIDQRYAIRLDRISGHLARLERRSDFVSEALGLFIQHALTMSAHEPPFEAATAHLGRRRYEAFLQLVWKRMSRPKKEPSMASSSEEVPQENLKSQDSE
jgi:hypothetical protein